MTPEEVAYFLEGTAAVYESGIDTSRGNVLCNLVTSSLSKMSNSATAYFKDGLSYALCVMLSRLGSYLEAYPLNYVSSEIYCIDGEGNETLMNWKPTVVMKQL